MSFSRKGARLCRYHLFVWSNLNFLHISQSINLLIQSYYYYSLIRAFHISVSRWFFTGVWVIASLLKSPGLFLVFWPFSTMLSFGWSPLVRQLPSTSSPFSNPLVTVPNAPITIGIIVTCMFNSLARSRYLSLFSHSFSFILWLTGTAKSTILHVLFYYYYYYYYYLWQQAKDSLSYDASKERLVFWS